MGAPEVGAFLTMLATERRVLASTHNQALSALLFLYREVLSIDLTWLDGVSRPAQKRRIPSVLTKEEVVSRIASAAFARPSCLGRGPAGAARRCANTACAGAKISSGRQYLEVVLVVSIAHFLHRPAHRL